MRLKPDAQFFCVIVKMIYVSIEKFCVSMLYYRRSVAKFCSKKLLRKTEEHLNYLTLEQSKARENIL